jgi:hypothetical protein
MFPLLLGLGILAANQFAKDKRDDTLASQYRGLLGVSPGAMGPPDEGGAMGGQTGGTGLLADPKDIGRQMEFAAGVAGLRGQQPAGLQMLNAAFGRAQQQSEQAQQAQQFGQQFQRSGEQFAQTFGAGREDAAAMQARAEREFELRQREAQRQGEQWRQQFGLSQRADQRAEAMLGMERDKANAPPDAPAMPKLPVGWTYQPGPAGEAIAAPIPGTTDWSTGVAKAESLQSADKRIGQMLDMLQGAEETTPAGRQQRKGGVGSELYGENAAKYSVLRGQVIADVAKLRDMGVLQAGEMERIEEQLADPTTWGAMFTGNRRMGKGYEELRKQFKEKREQHFRANPWLIPSVPAGYEPVKQ